MRNSAGMLIYVAIGLFFYLGPASIAQASEKKEEKKEGRTHDSKERVTSIGKKFKDSGGGRLGGRFFPRVPV